MKPRHWNRMQETTGHVFDVENENFTLRSILEAPLLRHKEEIEVSENKKCLRFDDELPKKLAEDETRRQMHAIMYHNFEARLASP